MQSCFCFLICVFSKHTKRQPDDQDAPNDDTRGMMVKTIHLKLSRSTGEGGKAAEKDKDKNAERGVEENKYLMKDNSV